MAVDLSLGSTDRRWGRDTIVCGEEPLVWTPSAVRAELDRARDLLDIANREMSKAVADRKVSGDEWKAWSDTYKTSHKLVSSASPMWGSNVAIARHHAAEAEKWRDLVRQRGGQELAPRGAGRPAQQDEKALSKREMAAIGIGGAVALAMLIKAVRK